MRFDFAMIIMLTVYKIAKTKHRKEILKLANLIQISKMHMQT